VERCRSG